MDVWNGTEEDLVDFCIAKALKMPFQWDSEKRMS